MKYLILHAGGMADHPQKELGGRTPLEASATPHLDRLAQSADLGPLMFSADRSGQGSGLSGTAILGYDPKKFYHGPGPLEAASLGVSLTEHDVAYRCTMVTLKPEGGRGGWTKSKNWVRMSSWTMQPPASLTPKRLGI